MNGHICINYDLIKKRCESKNKSSREDILQEINSVLTHEIIHSATTSNYRQKYKEQENDKADIKYPYFRRFGAWNLSKRNSEGKVNIYPRGLALTEALTEKMNMKILGKERSDSYENERNKLNYLQKAFNLSDQEMFELLVKRS